MSYLNNSLLHWKPGESCFYLPFIVFLAVKIKVKYRIIQRVAVKMKNLCFLIDPSEITFCEFGMLILFYNLSNLLKKKAQKTAVMS